MIDASDVRACAEAYAGLWRDGQSAEMRTAILHMLDAAASVGETVTSRARLAGHVTCSSLAIDEGRNIAMIHHKALDRWLLPGGHVELGDASLADAARRELTEELGLPSEAVWPATAFLGRRESMGQTFMSHRIPFDIDMHPIPANERKGEPSHVHCDFRWLVQIDPTQVSVNREEALSWEMVSPFDERVPERARQRLLDPRLSLALFPPPPEAPVDEPAPPRQGRLAL